MKHLLLVLGLIASLLPAQERQRTRSREGAPQELQQRLEQMQQRLEQLQNRLEERRPQQRERAPEQTPQGRGEQAPRRGGRPQFREMRREGGNGGAERQRHAPLRNHPMLRLRMMQMHRAMHGEHRGPAGRGHGMQGGRPGQRHGQHSEGPQRMRPRGEAPRQRGEGQRGKPERRHRGNEQQV